MKSKENEGFAAPGDERGDPRPAAGEVDPANATAADLSRLSSRVGRLEEQLTAYRELAHSLNNHLTIIHGYASLLQVQISGQRERDMLDAIVKAAREAGDMLHARPAGE